MHTMLRTAVIFISVLGLASYAGADSPAVPKRASIQVVPSRYDGVITKTGNVEVVFEDGHKEMWTHDGNCHSVLVSDNGDVGWIRIDKQHVDERMFPKGKDSLVVRQADGTTREFSPYAQPPDQEDWYIEDWRFADDGAAVILRSMGHHGPSSFVKYSLATGKVEDSRAGYTPYNQLPAWAKPLGDPEDR